MKHKIPAIIFILSKFYSSLGEVVGITPGQISDGSQANLNYAWSIDVIKQHISYGQ